MVIFWCSILVLMTLLVLFITYQCVRDTQKAERMTAESQSSDVTNEIERQRAYLRKTHLPDPDEEMQKAIAESRQRRPCSH